MKRILALLLSLLLLCTAFAGCSKKEKGSDGLEMTLNQDGQSYTVTGAGNFDGKELVIPAEYNGKPVTAIGENAFQINPTLEKVTLPEGLVTIGNKAFFRCDALTEITIPKTVTAIGNQAFSSCFVLKKVTFDKNSALTTLGQYAFFCCFELTEITIPQGVTTIKDSCFEGCGKLSSITFENPNGWKAGDVALSADSLLSGAASLLTNTHAAKAWTRQ